MHEQPPKSFADIEIGDEIGPLTYTPTLADIRRYAAEVQMVDQRFMSQEIARQRGSRISPLVFVRRYDTGIPSPASAL
jgi:hypothetical protein